MDVSNNIKKKINDILEYKVSKSRTKGCKVEIGYKLEDAKWELVIS